MARRSSTALADPALAQALETALDQMVRAERLAEAVGPGSDERARVLAMAALVDARQELARLKGEVGDKLAQVRRTRSPMSAYANAAALRLSRKR
ncbi:hypothetical protein [Pararhodospirillum photometricum]|uniref:Uncharacterized protein n=1 Tax=Pararhodospirillum photometricum DSM 122 TaxID=1150469 RepID=H6SN72_PARPM|nr:hypothetical protein [Pararhodospirillum photometricum]CCG06948.1 unnamed protein product [Pararhodospirillum photometricum DSM 122]